MSGGASERFPRWPQAAAAAFCAASYAVAFLVVRAYYETHLPHYDSIDSYGVMFEVMRRATQDGWRAGLDFARTWPISWLHPFYAFALAPFAPRSPEWLVSLNFLLLLVAQLSIIHGLRLYGMGPWRQLAGALLPVLPGIFFVWDGGLPDLRRDTQMTLLLIAVAFLSLAYSERPSVASGLRLGVVMGLTQWSRDNAAALLLLVLLPAAALPFFTPKGRRAPLLAAALWPLAGAAALAGPYLLATFRLTLHRYRNVVWGTGEDRMESLRAFWTTPLDMMIAGQTRLNGKPELARANLWTFAAIAVVLAAALASGRLRLRLARLASRPARVLLGSGAFVVAAVVLYTTLGLGYGARWHGMPFMPVVVGIVLCLAGLLAAFEARPGERLVRAAVVLVAAGLVAASGPRLLASRFDPAGEAEVAAARDASIRIAQWAAGQPVGILWTFGFSRHHIGFYLAQAGLPPLRVFERRAGDAGEPVDLEQPLRAEVDVPALRQRLGETLRKHAAYVFVCEDLTAYSSSREVLWYLKVGEPVVAALRNDAAFRPVERFRLGGRDFALLENLAFGAATAPAR